ncbi:MAG: long-chain-fatty-acid--CoA ligase [Sulfobacillus sp.]
MEVAQTPIRFLTVSERLFADKEAVVCKDVRLTYRQFGKRVRQMAGALAALGVGRGDRVAYLGLNCHRLVELYYAVPGLGAILSPLNVRLTQPELEFILGDLGARVLITDATLAPLAARLEPTLRGQVICLDPGQVPANWLDYETLLAATQPLAELGAGIDESDVAEIFYTSGTTGRPKGVMLTHRNLHQHALGVAISLPVQPEEIQLVGTVPLFHVNGWGAPHYIVAMGATQVVTARFEPSEFFRLVKAEHVTLAMMVPSMLAALLSGSGEHQGDLTSLQHILIGGAPPPPTLIRAARRDLGVRCTVGYGLSETSPVLTIANVKPDLMHLPAEAQDELRARTGIPMVGVEVRVMDAQGREVAWDDESIGEIWARADSVSPGYWNRPAETQEVFVDGWFHTGDMAVVNKEGYLQIVDRKKDIIISGGENISSVEVENALYSHPAVFEAAVVAIPDEKWGEVPYAFVALKPQATASAEELLTHLRTQLAGFKIPKSIEFRAELPKTGTGKVMKQELRRPFWPGR